MTMIYTKERVSAFKYRDYVISDAIVEVVNKRLGGTKYKRTYENINVMTPFAYIPNACLRLEKGNA